MNDSDRPSPPVGAHLSRPHLGGDPARRIETFRALAASGGLAGYASTAALPQRMEVIGCAYEIALPVVFSRLTRRIEQRRGHVICATGIHHLADECLDRFEDDMEAVVEDLLVHATKPILSVEAWVASRLTVATVNGHRRWRGRRGALQRPRPPGWVTRALGHDPWLVDLATQVLIWVGNGATAGWGTWPLDSWSQRRAAATGDWAGSDPGTVGRDVETVLAAMRRRPAWYRRYVETPLGGQETSVAPVGDEALVVPLALTDRSERDDARLVELAGAAIGAIESRLRAGVEEEVAVTEVLCAVFGVDVGADELDRAPHTAPTDAERVSALVADPAVVRRVIVATRAIIADAAEAA